MFIFVKAQLPDGLLASRWKCTSAIERGSGINDGQFFSLVSPPVVSVRSMLGRNSCITCPRLSSPFCEIVKLMRVGEMNMEVAT